MKALISDFTSHLGEALEIGNSARLKPHERPINAVLISGLGGSGIGGTIVSQLIEAEASVPVMVNKNYVIPGFVDENTLVIICSYSGNTEETINSMNQASEKGALICCITSGGAILQTAADNGLDCIVIPSGYPPRAAFGYSFPQLFYALCHFGIISTGFEHEFKAAIALIDREEERIRVEARSIGEQLFGKIPVIYSDASFEGVAVRFRQQVNENAKMLCWHHALPEMNHNELVGWTTRNDDLAVIIFRNETDFDRTQKRMEISKEVFKKYANTVIEAHSKGESAIERTLYLIHLGDWISFFLAEKKGIDPVEVKVIDYLKGELAKHR